MKWVEGSFIMRTNETLEYKIYKTHVNLFEFHHISAVLIDKEVSKTSIICTVFMIAVC